MKLTEGNYTKRANNANEFASKVILSQDMHHRHENTHRRKYVCYATMSIFAQHFLSLSFYARWPFPIGMK